MSKRNFLSFQWIAGSILVLATLAITGVNVHLVMKSNKDFSDVELKNIEALTQESSTSYGILYSNYPVNDTFCCCPGGDKNCSASGCPSSVCNSSH
jgi:hypothetical protein